MSEPNARMDRRAFIRTTAAGLAAVGAGSAWNVGAFAAEADPKKLIRRNESPEFQYRRLGRTNFNCGRIVAGWIKENNILRSVISRGVNYLDTARGYGEYEVDLAALLPRIRDKVWITSKASDIAGYTRIDAEVENLYRKAMGAFLGDTATIRVKDSEHTINPGEAKREAFLGVHQACVAKMKATGEAPDWRPLGERMAAMYSRMLDESLARMKIDNVDCYMMHGVEIPWIFQCTELWDAFEKAQKAGKVKHFGFSTHRNQKEVLAATVVANEQGPWKIDLIMPGVTPTSFHDYRPELEALKKQDVGIIAMKTSGTIRHAATKREEKLAEVADGKKLNEWERAKTYMLHATDDLIDACISAVKTTEEVDRTLSLPAIQIAAAERKQFEAAVLAEMTGACHFCGRCTMACPEHIAVDDLLRYHAYIHQYDDRALAASLYQRLGYDPASLCSNCGTCTDVCPESIDLARAVNEVVENLA